MILKALLVVALVMGVLFAWRAWRHLPSLAILAAAAAAVCGMLLLKNPLLAGIGLLAAVALVTYLARPRQ